MVGLLELDAQFQLGAGASAGMGGLVLVTSHGFSGSYAGSRFSRSVGVIAGEGTKMERDHDFDSRLYFAELDSPEEIGRRAAERAIASGRQVIIFPEGTRVAPGESRGRQCAGDEDPVGQGASTSSVVT